MRRIGIRTQNIRTSKGMTVRQLSEATGLSKRYLELIESGGRTPSVQSVYRLAEALNVRPAALLQDEPDEEPALAVAS